jgi:hypothetical protein
MNTTYIVRTANSEYAVDVENKIISGGAYGDREVPYLNIQASSRLVVTALRPENNLLSSEIRSVEFVANEPA